VVLEHGEVIASGPPEEVRADPRVVDAYLGTGGADPAAGSPAAADAARTLAAAAGSGVEMVDLHAGHGDLRVLHGVSLAVPPGRVTALIGANGAGKSTLLAAAAGLLPARGTVRLDGSDVSRLPAERRAAAGLTLVPERRQLFERLTVFEHLLVGGYARTGPWRSTGAARGRLAERIAAVERLFPRLAERRAQVAGTLSGGEQQMLALARGLMGNPRCLMLDEPSLGLAPSFVADILQVLAGLAEGGMPVLLVEQNARAALRVARHAAVLERGRVVAEGEAEAIAADPRVRAAYLGV
ncbi:MAG TPA: ATP-binding cassette domain-containing protein, partial [Anaeromyxobacter sp.]|nr:ATP-binding cassette domain-containing protein [Anaeromyxobacter sp.]